jgi:hypothetical protein
MIHSVGTAAGGTLSLVNSVLPGGGGSSAGSAFVLDGSIGQPVATTTASEGTPGGIAGRAGFWSQVVRWINVAPVAQGDAIDRRSGQSTHVLIRTLLGNDSATDLEVLRFVSFSSASAAGGTIFRDGPWLVYQPPATGGDPADDSFTYTIRDALGTMATGTVRIRISSAPAGGPPNALGVDHLTGPPATVRVHFLGIAGRKYVVETANDAAGPWSNAGELTASADGSMTYSEADAGGSRFFRIRETP